MYVERWQTRTTARARSTSAGAAGASAATAARSRGPPGSARRTRSSAARRCGRSFVASPFYPPACRRASRCAQRQRSTLSSVTTESERSLASRAASHHSSSAASAHRWAGSNDQRAWAPLPDLASLGWGKSSSSKKPHHLVAPRRGCRHACSGGAPRRPRPQRVEVEQVIHSTDDVASLVVARACFFQLYRAPRASSAGSTGFAAR